LTALKRNFLKLNRLILFTALTATIITFINSLYSNYQVQREQLVLQALDVNQAYARKLADTTEVFLHSTQQQLAYSAEIISDKMEVASTLAKEADRLKYQTNTFNSVVVIDSDGIAQATSPETLGLFGKQVSSEGTVKALRDKKPQISAPYISSLKNLLIVISSPIFDELDNYRGFIGGTIYLKEKNILNKILGEHYYSNGSYIYVVDKNKQILYHPEQDRIGTFVKNNNGLDEIIANEEGGLLLTNSKNIDMLAGYSKVTSTGWTVVTQSPVESTLLPLTGIMEKVIMRTMPMAFAVFLFIWVFARAISKPLQQLADKAKLLDSPSISNDIEKINSWYVESLSLKKAILSGMKLLHSQIGQLQHDVRTDPLTGANNRRAFQLKLEQLTVLESSFSILALDIDYFKNINDTYGHKIGDDVLKEMVKIMTAFSRDGDMVVRTGGEEFVLLLKDCPIKEALACAERLRITIADKVFENVGHLTVSIGIAAWDNESVSIERILSLADEALYEAKGQGRNRCIIAQQP
jgi:diguanylate cyclase (GGDEF)-like protein